MKERIGKTENAVLRVIAVTGIIAIGLVAPNTLKAFKGLAVPPKKQEAKNDYIKNKVLYKLKSKKLVTFEVKDNKKYIVLTTKGKKLLDIIKYQNIKISNPKKWDKKWRVIIFDIKENRRKVRDQFRFHIQNLGFIQLQRSVWVYPYPCDTIIQLLKADLLAGKEILYMVVEKIENDKWLKKEFNLT